MLHYQISSLIKDGISQYALKYVYSKATYYLIMSQLHQFTCVASGEKEESTLATNSL